MEENLLHVKQVVLIRDSTIASSLDPGTISGFSCRCCNSGRSERLLVFRCMFEYRPRPVHYLGRKLHPGVFIAETGIRFVGIVATAIYHMGNGSEKVFILLLLVIASFQSLLTSSR
jgi:hypothetical protein